MDTTRQRQIAAAIGSRIARQRQDSGLTQEEVAERMEIGNEAISRIERGVAAPTLARLFEFAELYGCRVDQLLLGSSDREVDQAASIANQLVGLAPADRQLVAAIVEQMAAHLRKKPGGKRKG